MYTVSLYFMRRIYSFLLSYPQIWPNIKFKEDVRLKSTLTQNISQLCNLESVDGSRFNTSQSKISHHLHEGNLLRWDLSIFQGRRASLCPTIVFLKKAVIFEVLA